MKKLPHFYWTKKDISYNSGFLSETGLNSGLLVDPFMGSGSLILGLDSNNFKTVGIELNEMPVFMLRTFLKHLNKSSLANTKEEFKKIQNEYSYIYQISCPECGCKCDYDRFVFNKDSSINARKIKAKCNDCGYGFEDQKLNNSALKEINNHFVEFSKMCTELEDQVLIKNSRIAIKEGMKISDLFSPMNFYLLGKIKSKKNLSDLSKYVLASILHNARMTDQRSQSQFPYWVPKKNILNKNIFNLLFKKIKELEKYQDSNKLKIGEKISDISDSNVTVLHGASQSLLSKFEDNSIDVVLTDPPYYDQVAYSEYLKIWEFFLNFKTDFKNEIVETNRTFSASDRSKYLDNMANVFSLLNQKMKETGSLIIYFKDSKEKNYMDFISLMIKSGFNFIKQKHLNAKKITYRQVSSSKTTSRGDCIIFFNKQTPPKEEKNKIHKEELQGLVVNKVRSYLIEKEKASTGELLDNVIYYQIIFHNLMYELNEKEIIQLLEENFDFIENFWTLNAKEKHNK